MADDGVPVTLCVAFQRTVALYPQEIALRTPGDAVTFTWGEYASRVREIAAGLAGFGVRGGDTVALMMTNRPEFHLVDTAAFHLGAVPFSVYNTFAPEQITHVVSSACSRVVICEQQFAAKLLAVRDDTPIQHVVCVDGRPKGAVTLEELVAGGDAAFGFEACWRAVKPGDVLTLIYTSGTTGPPKGVEITHAQMLANLAAVTEVAPARGRSPHLLPAHGARGRAVGHPLRRDVQRPAGHPARRRQCAARRPERRPAHDLRRRAAGVGEAEGRHRSHGGVRARPGQARHAAGVRDRAPARAGRPGRTRAG
jgi:long-subunit acyl-CoA synthetase (AMP-forming)